MTCPFGEADLVGDISLILHSASPPAEQALWEQIWEQRRAEIALAVTMLLVLTTILLFQDALTRRVSLYRATRLTFLAMIQTLGRGAVE